MLQILSTNWPHEQRITGAEITQQGAIDSAKLHAISVIMSRMGSKVAPDIERGMEMGY